MDEALKALGIDLKGLTYDQLKPAERATLNQWLDSIQKNEMTVEKIRDFVHMLRDNIEQEFLRVNLNEKEEIFLKARLKNILMIESFLMSPERAKKALQQAIKGVE